MAESVSKTKMCQYWVTRLVSSESVRGSVSESVHETISGSVRIRVNIITCITKKSIEISPKYTIHCTLCSVQRTMYNVFVQCVVYGVYCTVCRGYGVRRTLSYTVRRRVIRKSYVIRCKMHDVRCTLYTKKINHLCYDHMHGTYAYIQVYCIWTHR